jgi:hypothetical protein
VGVLHELFHAHQAKIASPHFLLTRQHDGRQPDYPYADTDFAEAWNRERRLLAQALTEKSQDQARKLVREFLHQRNKRRSRTKLTEYWQQYERHMEWLEDTALYEYTNLRWTYKDDIPELPCALHSAEIDVLQLRGGWRQPSSGPGLLIP